MMILRRIVGPVVTILFALQFLSVEAMAHVRGFKFNHLDRKMEAAKRATRNAAHLAIRWVKINLVAPKSTSFRRHLRQLNAVS